MSVHLLHKNSKKLNEVPTQDDLQYGQLGIQYAATQVALWTKDSEGQVVRIAYADDPDAIPPELYGYATEEWVLSQEYITLDDLPPYPEVPDLAGYATETWVLGQGFITEAEANGKQYVRQDEDWIELDLSTAGIQEPANDGLVYGRQTIGGVSSWIEIEGVDMDPIQDQLDQEILDRQDGDDALRELIEEERAFRIQGDQALQDQIDNLENGNASLIFSDTAPEAPFIGLVWFDTSRMETRIWYDDQVDSQQWVPISLAFGGVQDQPGGGGYDDAELRTRIGTLEEKVDTLETQVSDLQAALATCLKMNEEYHAALVTLGTADGDLEPAMLESPVKFTVTS